MYYIELLSAPIQPLYSRLHAPLSVRRYYITAEHSTSVWQDHSLRSTLCTPHPLRSALDQQYSIKAPPSRDIPLPRENTADFLLYRHHTSLFGGTTLHLNTCCALSLRDS
jgi:hypothetical protein